MPKESKYYQGKFYPKNPKKYRGDPNNIVYRSSWELKFMIYCDTKKNIIEWGSEEYVIPYVSPMDGEFHRYFVDFYVKVRTKDNVTKKYLVEVKPESQIVPPKQQKRKTKRFLTEVSTFAVNRAKWLSAKDFCENNNMSFMLLTYRGWTPVVIDINTVIDKWEILGVG
ncbi:MAG: head completion protein [Thermoplasmata archaeon M11B2D]|nr:MAG: head completion protein [Thermoplasmata archaeon M11B2D]